MTTAWRTAGGEVHAEAKTRTSSIALGDLREVVQRANELGLADEADVYVGGVCPSTLLVDLAAVRTIRVRQVAYTKHEPPGEVIRDG